MARPLSVLLSSIGTSVNLREMALLSRVAPRGIVAAAISSLFALRLEEQGIAQAAEIVPLTFVMIIGTVVVTSLSAGKLAELLGLSSRSEQGVLITNANKVSMVPGEALKNNVSLPFIHRGALCGYSRIQMMYTTDSVQLKTQPFSTV